MVTRSELMTTVTRHPEYNEKCLVCRIDKINKKNQKWMIIILFKRWNLQTHQISGLIENQ